MKILMLSMEKTLLGEQVSGGDAIERHKKYGQFCDELHIIVLSAPGYQSQKLADNVFVWPTNSKNKLSYLSDAIKIASRIHKENNLDLIMCQDIIGYIGLKISKKLKRKFLLSIHGDFFDNKNNQQWIQGKWFNRFLIFMLKRVIKKADGIRVVSQGIKNKLIKRNVDKNKIRVISTPVNINKFQTFDQSRIYELEQKYPNKNILFVGRLEPVKNLEWFLDVFKEIKKEYKNVNFLIIGEGSLKNKLKSKTEELKIRDSVKFINQVEHDDLTNYYNIADVIVLSSTSESFGKVLVEANACAKPVVSTATTGAKEIIQNEYNGFLIPIRDESAMVEKILYLLNNPEKAKQMGENGRKLVKEKYSHSTDEMVRFWKDLTEI